MKFELEKNDGTMVNFTHSFENRTGPIGQTGGVTGSVDMLDR